MRSFLVTASLLFCLGCGLTEQLGKLKELNDDLKAEVGGEPNVNYSSGTNGKVVKVKYFGDLEDEETAKEKTVELVKKHMGEVDQVVVWKCSKAGAMERCVGL